MSLESTGFYKVFYLGEFRTSQDIFSDKIWIWVDWPRIAF